MLFRSMGLFQFWATACNLENPWLRSGTVSPCIGINVLSNSIYTDLSNLPTHQDKRTQIQNSIHPSSLTDNKGQWQYTYTRLMSKYYYKGNANSTYDWENYSTDPNYQNTYKQWLNDKLSRLDKIKKERSEERRVGKECRL